MKRTSRLLGAAGFITLAVLASNPALAAGTTAGSTITNTATVNYQVGGVAQTAASASDTLTVDRKVNLTVAEVGTTTTTVVPGQLAAVTTFTVTNTSNAVLDFALTAAQAVAAHGGTDSFDVSNVKIYIDSGTSGTAGTFDPGIDVEVASLDELAADASKTVYVVADVPLGLANGAVAGVSLTATGREGGTAGSLGAVLTQTAGANTAGMDTVFGDVAGAVDGSRDAAHSARDDYTVATATLTVVKSSKVISDPLNGATDPKAIPGAVIEYCIAVTNSGSVPASNVAITDTLPATLTADSSYQVKVNGTVVSGVCQTNGTDSGAPGSPVTGTITSLGLSETKTVLFRATIN